VNNRRPIVYVVDDDVSVRRALSLLLKSYGFDVQTFARSGDFLACSHPKVPSCLVLDIRLPDINGLALQDAMSVKGMKAGAIDFLTKPFSKKKLLGAVTLAISKNKSQNKEQAAISKIKRRIKTLSPRELEVFRLVAKGMLSKQIAFKRGISLQTIKVHRSRVMQKMQAKTVTELIRFAQKAGFISS
jgi:FixJ family two-component response regulator